MHSWVLFLVGVLFLIGVFVKIQMLYAFCGSSFRLYASHVRGHKHIRG